LPDTKPAPEPVELKGDVCPVCSWDFVSGDGYDIVEGVISQDMACNECNAEWTNFYTLSDCTITNRPDPKEETLSIKQSLGKAIHLIQVFQTEDDVTPAVLENALHHLDSVSEAIDAMDALMGDE
jgi:hypothetical protein